LNEWKRLPGDKVKDFISSLSLIFRSLWLKIQTFLYG